MSSNDTLYPSTSGKRVLRGHFLLQQAVKVDAGRYVCTMPRAADQYEASWMREKKQEVEWLVHKWGPFDIMHCPYMYLGHEYPMNLEIHKQYCSSLVTFALLLFAIQRRNGHSYQASSVLSPKCSWPIGMFFFFMHGFHVIPASNFQHLSKPSAAPKQSSIPPGSWHPRASSI